MSDKFDLSLSYSHYNGAVVLERQENSVKIGLTDFENMALRKRLSKAVVQFFALKGKNFSQEECCRFEKIDRKTLMHHISLRYGESSREEERKNEGSEAAMLLDTLLNEAIKRGASDIHIEERRVRFRIAGLLEEISELSPEKSRELARRVKLLANLNVLEERQGQDGQFIFSADDEIFVRVSSIPALSCGESAESLVLRLLNVSRIPLSIKDLGFTPSQCELLKKVIRREQGLVLICGPTGSGKSTTAASLLTELKDFYEDSKKIITIEDPPEYVLDGITQIRVDENTGMSFSQALRFIFRQDPDVIFVGEIRDSLSAKTVLQAALTGHLVFATLHTSGVLQTGVRMKELGVDFSQLSSVTLAMIFQNLSVKKSESVEEGRKVTLESRIVCPGDREFNSLFYSGQLNELKKANNSFPMRKLRESPFLKNTCLPEEKEA